MIFFFILAFIDDRSKHAVIDKSKTSSEMFTLSLNYLSYILIYMMPLVLVLSVPLYGAFKTKNGMYFSFFVTMFFLSEFGMYTYFYATSDPILGVYNVAIGVMVWIAFFYRSLQSKFSNVTSGKQASRKV